MREKDLLLKIGLSEKEAEIYLILLSFGKLSAYEIAKKSGIYRPYVYDKLEVLKLRGLVSFVLIGKKRIYSPAPPSKLMDYLKEREMKIKKEVGLLNENLKKFNDLYNLPKTDTKVEVFSGKEGLKLFLKDTQSVKGRKEILIFGLDDKRYDDALPIFMPQHFKILRKNKIKERVITQKKKGIFMYNNSTTTYRFLDSKEFNPTNTAIYGDKIALIVWGIPITSIIIENKQLAKTYREHFEYLWGLATKELS